MAFSASLLDELRSRTRVSNLVGRCGVKLVRRGSEFVGLCPFHPERTPSFTVADDKQFFHCFGCGAHGDVFAFLMLVHNIDFRAAVAKIAGGVGAEMPEGPRVGAVSNINLLGDRGERNRELAWRLWTAAGDPRGTPVEKYLHHRGLELPPNPVLRWAPRCWNRETSRELPAMLARVDGSLGKFVAVHRTWLLPDGSGKAELREPKSSLGPINGAAVRLVPVCPVLAVAEGIETALTAIVSGVPAWAALSAGGIERLILPAEVVEVVIIGDHDLSGVGQCAAQHAASRLLADRTMPKGGPAALGGADRMDIGRGEPLGTARKGRAQDQILADVRQQNRHQSQLIRNLRRVYGYGFIATGGLAIELAVRVGGLSVPQGALKEFANGLDHRLLRIRRYRGEADVVAGNDHHEPLRATI